VTIVEKKGGGSSIRINTCTVSLHIREGKVISNIELIIYLSWKLWFFYSNPDVMTTVKFTHSSGDYFNKVDNDTMEKY